LNRYTLRGSDRESIILTTFLHHYRHLLLVLGSFICANSYADYCENRLQTHTPASFELAQTQSKDFPALDDKIIRHVVVHRYNVFDQYNEKENGAIYTSLNNLHVITTQDTVTDDLLFKPGMAYKAVLLQESERILRHRKYIFDANIRPISVCNKFVDIEVATRDTWTITPALSISRSGGESKSKLSITESNFLGSGKLISFSKLSTKARTEYTLRYRDPNISGTHRTTSIELSKNSDGDRQYFSLALPFFSLDSKKSYGINYQNEQRLDPIYQQQDKIFEIDHQISYYDFYYGISSGYIDNKTKRWRAGITYRLDTLDDLKGLAYSQQRRRLLYPWLEYSFLENNYTKIQNYQSIKRTEDLNLGRIFSLKLGYSHHTFSDDDSRLVINLRSQNAMKFDQQLVTAAGSIKGYWNKTTGNAQGLRLKAKAGYYRFIDEDWVFYTGVKLNYLANPLPEQQLFLGGETGLRGYPVRFNEGTKNALLSIEQRYYSDSYFLQLVRLGAAAYIDIGRSWDPQLAMAPINQGWYASVGIGLRITPSRVDANHVIHVDLATPFKDRSQVDSVQFIVKVKQSF